MPGAVREYDMTARASAAGRTRDRLLRAARDRFGGGRYDDVTLAEVAGAAGVSVQTLLNHFGSKQGLLAASAEFFAGEIDDLRGPVEPGDVAGAVEALLRQYEALGDANWRFVADSERQTSLQTLLDSARAEQRAWIESVFGPRVPEDPAEHHAAITALYAITDVGTWKLLRRDLGCTLEQTRAVLHRLIVGQLEG